MKKQNIALIGFRATGKTTVGHMISEKLQWRFVDMDEYLVTGFGQDIQSFVRSHGWESFREAESDLLKVLAPKRKLVIATGGGIVIKPSNREVLKEKFTVFWLRSSPDIIYARLLQDPKTEAFRPSLTHLPMKEEIKRLVSQRSPWYDDTSDFILETDTLSTVELVNMVLDLLKKETPLMRHQMHEEI